MKWNFSDLQQVMNTWTRSTPEIKIKYYKTSVGYLLTIYADMDEFDNGSTFVQMQKYLSWADTQLKKWPGVIKQGINMWSFTDFNDVEKFKVLFSLKFSK